MQIGWRSVIAIRKVCGGKLTTEKLSTSEKGARLSAIAFVFTIGNGTPICFSSAFRTVLLLIRLVPVTSSFSTARSGVNMVARIRRKSSPKDPSTDRETILRLRDAATNRLASGESLVNSPTRACLAGLTVLEGCLDDLAVTLAAGLAAALAALLGASGVTVEGALGSPFAAVFLAGPGRFNLAL